MTITLFYRIECDREYDPPSCFRKSCTPQDHPVLGHYNCSFTGDKICLPGWFGPESNCSKNTLIQFKRISSRINNYCLELLRMHYHIIICHIPRENIGFFKANKNKDI